MEAGFLGISGAERSPLLDKIGGLRAMVNLGGGYRGIVTRVTECIHFGAGWVVHCALLLAARRLRRGPRRAGRARRFGPGRSTAAGDWPLEHVTLTDGKTYQGLIESENAGRDRVCRGAPPARQADVPGRAADRSQGDQILGAAQPGAAAGVCAAGWKNTSSGP